MTRIPPRAEGPVWLAIALLLPGCATMVDDPVATVPKMVIGSRFSVGCGDKSQAFVVTGTRCSFDSQASTLAFHVDVYSPTAGISGTLKPFNGPGDYSVSFSPGASEFASTLDFMAAGYRVTPTPTRDGCNLYPFKAEITGTSEVKPLQIRVDCPSTMSCIELDDGGAAVGTWLEGAAAVSPSEFEVDYDSCAAQ